MLEALLKRVNGLEKRLKEENKFTSPDDKESAIASESSREEGAPSSIPNVQRNSHVGQTPQPALQSTPNIAHHGFVEVPRYDQAVHKTHNPPTDSRRPQPTAQQSNSDALLDVYFGRLHGKPYYILDEAATRQKWQAGMLPTPIVNAIHAATARYVGLPTV